MEKICFKCQELKPLNEYYKHPQMGDGHLNKCKTCAKKDAREHRFGTNREAILLYDRQRWNKLERQEKHKVRHAEWERLHPDRKSAKRKVFYAVHTGKLKPHPCFVCGQKAEAHHPDYSRPLDVMWLCSAHHKQAHAIAKGYV